VVSPGKAGIIRQSTYYLLEQPLARITKSEQHQALETLTVLATFLLVVSLVSHRQGFVYASLVLLVVGLFVKPVAHTVSRCWLRFAEVLGSVNSKIVLAVTFYLFLTPLAFLFRLFAKNPLQLKNTGDGASLYVERKHRYTSADFEKLW